MVKLLASVNDLAEARLAWEAGADIIDLKDPRRGALGALSEETVGAIVNALGGRCPVSATVGDLPMEPKAVYAAVRRMAATGVDYVKIGWFPGGDWAGVLAALTPLTQTGYRLIAVLFGDDRPALHWVADLAQAGFTGVMLDTRDKAQGSLTQRCPLTYLDEFTQAARAQGLLCGLAGSLRAADVALLTPLQPDYLGFRGALCLGHARGAALDPEAVRQMRCRFTATSPLPA